MFLDIDLYHYNSKIKITIKYCIFFLKIAFPKRLNKKTKQKVKKKYYYYIPNHWFSTAMIPPPMGDGYFDFIYVYTIKKDTRFWKILNNKIN